MGVSSCVAGLVANRRLQEARGSAFQPPPIWVLTMHERGSCLCVLAVNTVGEYLVLSVNVFGYVLLKKATGVIYFQSP